MSLAEAIAAARAMRSTRPTKGARPGFPTGVERVYERELMRYADRIARETRAALRRRDDDYDGWTVARLRLELPEGAVRAAMRALDRAIKAMRTWSAAEVERVIRVPMPVETPGVEAVLAAWRRENVKLIKSIPEQMLDEVYDIITDAQATGRRVEDIAAEIEGRFDVSKSRARLIARDQVAKANGDLQRQRQSEAGITRYEWSSSLDERTRDRHRDLDGTIHRWDDPPIVDLRTGRREHPGGDYQCRCVPVPILDVLDEDD